MRKRNLSRLEDILNRRYAGQSLQEIGRAHGITREGVRQIILLNGPDDGSLDFSELEAQRRLDEQLNTLAKKLEGAKPCRVCGWWALRRSGTTGERGRTCSAECRQMWEKLRLILDEHEWKLHRMSQARSDLKDGRRAFSSVRTLLLEGESLRPGKNRWLTSAAHMARLRQVAAWRGVPVEDLLPKSRPTPHRPEPQA